MLEYWMASNETSSNGSELEMKEVIEHPGSAVLFAGYPSWLLYFAAGCCILFMLIGIPGNLITIAALFRTKKLRNATAVFIMNLSVSDLMFCCFNLPLATSTFWHGSWLHGTLLCRLFPLLRYGLVAVSLFTVLAITINRYVMIGHPRLYPKFYKPKYLTLMVLATWISGFGALVATWFERWGRFGLDPAIGSCSILPDVNGRSPKEFLFILAFLTPCIAIIVCYARIFYIVRKTALKSRRRDKVTTDIAKANLEVKYKKNFEDSALGSSCGATLTTTENGGSPTKSHTKNYMTSTSSPKSISNHRDDPVPQGQENHSQPVQPVRRKLSRAQSLQSVESPIKCKCNNRSITCGPENVEATSDSNLEKNCSCTADEIENMENKSTIVTQERDSVSSKKKFRSTIPNVRIQSENLVFEISDDNNSQMASSSSDEEPEEDHRSNFERSVEFLPFIDTHADQSHDPEGDSAFSNFENVAPPSIPNFRLYEADSPSEKSDTDNQRPFEDPRKTDCRLQVPGRYPRAECSEISSTMALRQTKTHSQSLEDGNRQQILNTKNLEDNGNGVSLPKGFLRNLEHNSELLSPRSAKYGNEISDEYVSSRSDSPSDRRGSNKKSNVFRRESRFRSVRNRAFESGKMSTKDKKLLKMILVIFTSFLICYLPITITKTFKDVIDWRGLNIAGYILIYLTTCINPVIYVVMSSEYRCAYKNVLLCRSESGTSNCKQQMNNGGRCYERRKKIIDSKN